MRLGFVCATLIVLGNCSSTANESHGSAKGDVVVTINGEAVSISEFEVYIEAERAIVYQHFKTTYNADDGPTFLTTTFGSERPIDMLRKRALDALVQERVVLAEARRHGFMEDSSLVEASQVDNERRDTGENPYGKRNLDRREFIRYRLARVRVELKKHVLRELGSTDGARFTSYIANLVGRATISIERAAYERSGLAGT